MKFEISSTDFLGKLGLATNIYDEAFVRVKAQDGNVTITTNTSKCHRVLQYQIKADIQQEGEAFFELHTLKRLKKVKISDLATVELVDRKLNVETIDGDFVIPLAGMVHDAEYRSLFNDLNFEDEATYRDFDLDTFNKLAKLVARQEYQAVMQYVAMQPIKKGYVTVGTNGFMLGYEENQRGCEELPCDVLLEPKEVAFVTKQLGKKGIEFFPTPDYVFFRVGDDVCVVRNKEADTRNHTGSCFPNWRSVVVKVGGRDDETIATLTAQQWNKLKKVINLSGNFINKQDNERVTITNNPTQNTIAIFACEMEERKGVRQAVHGSVEYSKEVSTQVEGDKVASLDLQHRYLLLISQVFIDESVRVCIEPKRGSVVVFQGKSGITANLVSLL